LKTKLSQHVQDRSSPNFQVW